jgi:hypothetical protein
MRKIISIAAVIALATAAGATVAGRDRYKTKTEECVERAKTKKFGVHFIKRDRWIRECIRGNA